MQDIPAGPEQPLVGGVADMGPVVAGDAVAGNVLHGDAVAVWQMMQDALPGLSQEESDAGRLVSLSESGINC